jgi:hypothetical protein
MQKFNMNINEDIQLDRSMDNTVDTVYKNPRHILAH